MTSMNTTTNGNTQAHKLRRRVDPTETPEQRFRRLTEYRMTRLIKVADQVRNLLGPAYQSTDEQKAKIVDAVFHIAHAMKAAAARGKKADGFKL